MGLTKIEPTKDYMTYSRDQWKKMAEQLKADFEEVNAVMIKYMELWQQLEIRDPIQATEILESMEREI